MTTVKKSHGHRKRDEDNHVRQHLQGEHDVKNVVVVGPLQERTEFSPSETKELG